MVAAAGFGPSQRVLNGNGKTPEEIDWAAREGVHAVNADHVAELDALDRAAARHGTTLRVALRVNPGVYEADYWFLGTENGISSMVLSRKGATPFQPSVVEAAMNGIDIRSSISPAMGSCSMTMTGRLACRSDGGGKMARTTPVPR